MADNNIPEFKTYADGEAIPPVDPEDIKRMHPRFRIEGEGWSWRQDNQAVLSPEADVTAVHERCDMIATMYIYKLLTPWQQGEGFDDAVFRVAATLPLREVKRHDYEVSGDEMFGFDPNAFAQRLVDETGVSFVWEPIATRVPEGTRLFSFLDGQEPSRNAKRQTRELVWKIWKRFSPLFSHSARELPGELLAALFADFLMDNMDLVRQLEESFRTPNGGTPPNILEQLERRAQRFPLANE